MVQLSRLTLCGWYADTRCVSTSSDIVAHSDDIWALTGSGVLLGRLPDHIRETNSGAQSPLQSKFSDLRSTSKIPPPRSSSSPSWTVLKCKRSDMPLRFKTGLQRCTCYGIWLEETGDLFCVHGY